MSKKLILLIIVLILVGISAGYVIYQYLQPASSNVMKGNHSLLLLTIDPGESRPGMGAVDMAFVVHVTDGNILNITPVYPGGMRHPTVDEPAETGAGGGKLLRHDSFWNNNTDADAKLAQEIVEYNTGMKTDGVVIVTPDAIDCHASCCRPYKCGRSRNSIWQHTRIPASRTKHRRNDKRQCYRINNATITKCY